MDIEKIAKLSRKDDFIIRKLEEISLYKEINEYISDDIPIKEKIYCWYYKTLPNKCSCGNSLKFLSFQEGYKKFCSRKCANSSEELKKQKILTNIERYGVANPMQNKIVKNKVKETILEIYGVDNVSKSDEIKAKKKLTSIKKYGVYNPQSLDSVKQKTKETCFEKYGVYSHNSNEEIKEKKRKSFLEKYEVEYPLQSYAIKEQIRISRRISSYASFLKILELNDYSMSSSEEDIINNKLFNVQCNKCKEIIEVDTFSIQRIHCKCRWIFSKDENDLKLWIESLGLKTERTNNILSNNKQIDIYLPDYNLAIEYNGLYWHSEASYLKSSGKNNKIFDKDYHLNKTLECQKKGIQLIHIFENEWKDEIKQSIVKSIIKAKLGLFDERIFARKCFVKELSQRDYNEFLELNHLQGSCVSKIRLGLFYNDELVSVMGFGKSRFKKDEVELIRFANKLNASIIGGFSKLLKYYIIQHKPDKLISYCDLRYFDGSGYLKNGFEVVSRSKPNYFYWKMNDKTLYSRMQFQKHKLKDKLEIYDENLSEHENMWLNNYYKVYDCGNLKLAINFEKI